MSILKWQQLLFRNLHLPSPTSRPQRMVFLLFPRSTPSFFSWVSPAVSSLFPSSLPSLSSHLQWPLTSLVFTRSLSFGSVLFQAAGTPLSAHQDTALGLSLCNLVPGSVGLWTGVGSGWGEGEGSFSLQITE